MNAESLIGIGLYFVLIIAWFYYNLIKHRNHRIQYSAIRKGVSFQRKYLLLKRLYSTSEGTA